MNIYIVGKKEIIVPVQFNYHFIGLETFHLAYRF